MKKAKSFEESLEELEIIVKQLEKGELTLDESLKVFQKGIELSKFCSSRLDSIEKKISILIEDGKGNLIEKNFEEEI